MNSKTTFQINMRNSVSEGVNTTDTNDETHSLSGQELTDATSASSSQSTSAPSEAAAGQI